MRTTLKRGIGQVAGNGDATAALPAGGLAPVRRYRQPEFRRSGLRLFGRILFWVVAALGMLVGALGGGSWLFFQKGLVEAIHPHSRDVKQAEVLLKAPPPGKATIALVIGYDHRFADHGAPSRSDTIMLIRAQPHPKAISLLSFPRDLRVNIVCPGHYTYLGKINAAYSDCKSKGTLATVKSLTGLPINYLITVNFRGFREVVDHLGGVWMDVDHRYYNRNVHTLDTNYASINLKPGYQRLSGGQALDYVRYRHTDSDLYRNARQQQFVKALKEQIAASFSLSNPLSIRSFAQLIGSIAHNVEIGRGGGSEVSPREVLRYALFAYSLPQGHVLQDRIDNILQASDNSDLVTDPSNIQAAVQDFTNPDVSAPEKAAARALGRRFKRGKLPKPRSVSVTVLNGNAVAGSAAEASYLLGQRGYRTLVPPNNLPANAPSQNHFKTTIYFDPAKKRSAAAAKGLANAFGSAVTVRGIPPTLQPLSAGAMTVVVVGKTFHSALAPAPVDKTPPKRPPQVRHDPRATLKMLKRARKKVPFRVEVPTVVEQSSRIAPDTPIRIYGMGDKHVGIRLTFEMPNLMDYWGVQETNWTDAPALANPSTTRTIKGRTYEFYFSGPHLHMVVLREHDASYWVVNSLTDALSNETMLAIAKGLRPLRRK